MGVHEQDRPFIQWADSQGLPYHYTDEHGLPGRCLKLYLGVTTAYIHHGKLHRLLAHSTGDLLDEMMCELSQLFALCATHRAYLEQARCRLRR